MKKQSNDSTCQAAYRARMAAEICTRAILNPLLALILLLSILATISACSVSPSSTYKHNSTTVPTAFDTPSIAETPTHVAAATTVPVQSFTPSPTLIPTAIPTNKLEIPDSIPDGFVYEGSGDSVIDIEHPDGLWVLYVKGNSESRFFCVSGYDSDMKQTQDFVFTTEPYEGVTYDLLQDTVTLEIQSKCSWRIEVRSVWTCPIIDQLQMFSGSGDSVILLNVNATKAYIEANEAGRFFSVRTKGDFWNHMVMTNEPYTGTVVMKYNPFLLIVKAIGDWKISLE